MTSQPAKAGTGTGGKPQGPLPPLLLTLTVVTGVVDAVSILRLALTAGLPGEAARDGIAALLALAMGIQNAVARRLAVPDLTTTVLTMTLTGIAADVRAQGHGLAVLRRRILAVATMFAGAVGGALLVLHAGTAPALGLATGLLAVVTAGTVLAARRLGPWRAGVTRAKSQGRSVLNAGDLR